MLATDIYTIGNGANTNIVYLPLRGVAFLADDQSATVVHHLRDKIPLSNDELRTTVYQQLSELNVLGTIADPRPQIEPIRHFRPTRVTIILTESCNLGCRYCYADAIPSRIKISWHVLKAALDFTVENAAVSPDRFAVITFLGGGEPTLQWSLFVQAVEYARQECANKGIGLKTNLVTNGTLLREDRVRWLASNIGYISLSFDILPEIQGLQRPYAEGRNSHAQVLKAMRLLSEAGCQFGLRSTITANSVQYLTEMVDYVHETIPVQKLQLEPMSENGRGLLVKSEAPDQGAFVTAFIRALHRGKELGIKVVCSASRGLDEMRARFCDIEFCVTAEGLVTACHRHSRGESPGAAFFIYGRHEAGQFRFEVDQMSRILNNNVFGYESCSDCFAKWNCGGDCLAARVKGNLISDLSPRCDLIRGVLQSMLLERLAYASGARHLISERSLSRGNTINGRPETSFGDGRELRDTTLG